MNVPIQQAKALVLSGFEQQSKGDFERAESDYRAALRLVGEHPTALQLLGLLLARRGEAAEGEAMMRRSLQVLPQQPHVWNNLGNLLDDQQRLPEALACFDRALGFDARYADAHYNRARLLLALKQPEPARASVEQAMACSSAPTAAQWHLLAQIEGELGALPKALSAVSQALALQPEHPVMLHTQATLLQRSHRHAEALRSHEAAQRLGLEAPDAHYNFGNTLQSLGRLDEAERAYREALRLDPLHQLALYDLARLRWRQGDEAFDADLILAAQQHPQSPHPPAMRAQLLWRAERYDEAADAYRQALVNAPQTAGFHDGLGRCLVRLGQIEAGLTAQQRAVQLAPRTAGIRSNLAASLLLAKQYDAAERECAIACEHAPQDQYAWALRGLAWQLLGDPRFAWLTDMGRLVQVIDLEPPVGFPDMARFNEALADELLGLHRDSEAPIDQTLRRGTQTLGDIFEQGHALVDALKARIAEAVDAYVQRLPVDETHPFLGRRKAHWRFADSWSSRLRDAGFHTNHVHPHGWLSSAYYVQVPAVCADRIRQEGWLRFGLPDLDLGLELTPLQTVQPQPGRLALFPSMLWHGTAPFHAAEHRLTLAFDVVPR